MVPRKVFRESKPEMLVFTLPERRAELIFRVSAVVFRKI